MAHPAQTYKNRLQEYAQKKCLPMPVYHVVNEGKDHMPQFKCSLTINGTRYESPPGFSNKKAAQNAAAKKAVEDLKRQGFKFKQRKWPKCVLAELASIKNMPPPTYHFIKAFTAIVEINGASYTGAPANSMKEAANKAAFEAIWAIDPQYYITLSHVELNTKIDSKQSTGESHASKSRSKMPDDNFTSNHELLGGMESKSAETVSEKLHVQDAPGVENETGVFYQDKEHEYEEIEKNWQSSQEVDRTESICKRKRQSSKEFDLTESISKRNRIESEDVEQMSQRTKKQKGKKRNDTTGHSWESIGTHPHV